MAFIIKQRNIQIPIPPKGTTSLNDSIRIFKQGEVENLSIRVHINQDYNDLDIKLTAPSGKSLFLRKGTDISKNDEFNKVFEGVLLVEFFGENVTGDWTLSISRNANYLSKELENSGEVIRFKEESYILENWSLRMTCSDKNSETTISAENGNMVQSKQYCTVEGVILNMGVSLDIDHEFLDDLKVSLIGPKENSVILHNQFPSMTNKLKKGYVEELNSFYGTNAKGNWTLVVEDNTKRATLRINSWNIDFTLGEINKDKDNNSSGGNESTSDKKGNDNNSSGGKVIITGGNKDKDNNSGGGNESTSDKKGNDNNSSGGKVIITGGNKDKDNNSGGGNESTSDKKGDDNNSSGGKVIITGGNKDKDNNSGGGNESTSGKKGDDNNSSGGKVIITGGNKDKDNNSGGGNESTSDKKGDDNKSSGGKIIIIGDTEEKVDNSSGDKKDKNNLTNRNKEQKNLDEGLEKIEEAIEDLEDLDNLFINIYD